MSSLFRSPLPSSGCGSSTTQPGTPLYNVSATQPLNGPLHFAALEQSIDEIARRHEILRTTFPLVDGGPVQVVAPASHLPVRIVDLRAQHRGERDQEARRLTTEESLRPFDLARGPLLRTTLLRLSEMEQLLLVTMHHIVSDGWSLGVFFRELAVLYEAYAARQASPLPELSIQYADFAIWQRERLQGGASDVSCPTGKSAWQARPRCWSFHRPSSATGADFPGAMLPFALSDALSGALMALAQREGVTLFMTLLAAFQVCSHRYTGQDDIAVGSPVAGRSRPEIEELIGFFVNTLVLRTDLAVATRRSASCSARVARAALAAYAHQDLPFERLVEELQPERNLSHNPLFQVMFVLQNARLHHPAPSACPRRPRRAARSGAASRGRGEVRPHALDGRDHRTAARALRVQHRPVRRRHDRADGRHFQVLLAGLVRDPDARLSDLPLLTEEECHQLLVRVERHGGATIPATGASTSCSRPRWRERPTRSP